MTEPSPARLAVQGFTQLAAWYTQLVGDQLARVARTAADGELDADAAAAAWTRSMALPFLGLMALVNEVVDAASLQTVGVRGFRSIESDTFEADGDGDIELSPRALTNGFGHRLTGVDVVRVGPVAQRRFKLVARAVPGDRIGVFRGRVVVGPHRQEQHVWLVVS